jgi:uncharacterized protein DUF3309
MSERVGAPPDRTEYAASGIVFVHDRTFSFACSHIPKRFYRTGYCGVGGLGLIIVILLILILIGRI